MFDKKISTKNLYLATVGNVRRIPTGKTYKAVDWLTTQEYDEEIIDLEFIPTEPKNVICVRKTSSKYSPDDYYMDILNETEYEVFSQFSQEDTMYVHLLNSMNFTSKKVSLNYIKNYLNEENNKLMKMNVDKKLEIEKLQYLKELCEYVNALKQIGLEEPEFCNEEAKKALILLQEAGLMEHNIKEKSKTKNLRNK